jgi:hypothetical protein
MVLFRIRKSFSSTVMDEGLVSAVFSGVWPCY